MDSVNNLKTLRWLQPILSVNAENIIEAVHSTVLLITLRSSEGSCLDMRGSRELIRGQDLPP